jgi:hypothetical protein
MRKNLRPRVAFLFVALLIASLVSHGPYVEMAGIILLCVCCLIAKSTRNELCSERTLTSFVAIVSIISSFYLYFLIAPNPAGAPALEKSANNNYLFMILVAIFVLCLRSLIITRLNDVTAAFRALVIFNNVILLVQTVTLIFADRYIDLVQPVTGEASRYLNYGSINPIFAYRPTGLYGEPSTFSAAVGVMAIGYVLLCRAQGLQPSKCLIALTIISMFVTQSTAAVIQSGILIAAVLLMWKGSVKVWVLALIALPVIISPGITTAYIDSFFMKLDATSGIRLALLDYIYNLRQGWDFWIGFGPFSVENKLYHMAQGDPNMQVASLNDSGLLHFFVIQFGILGLVFPAWIFVRMRKDLTSVLFFAVIMTSKLSYMYPVLFLGLLPLVMRLPESDKVQNAGLGDARGSGSEC